MNTKKVYAFIDSQNLNLSIRSLGWKLDYARFRVYLAEKYGVSNAYIFIGFKEGNSDLYQKLQEAGYVLIFKPTLVYKDGTTKGNVDAELVLHAMIELKSYSKAIIVSGDGDFFCLAEYLIKQNKLLKLLIPNQRKYSALLKVFDSGYLAFVSDLKSKLVLAPKKKEPRADKTAKGASRGDYSKHTKKVTKSQPKKGTSK